MPRMAEYLQRYSDVSLRGVADDAMSADRALEAGSGHPLTQRTKFPIYEAGYPRIEIMR